MFANDFDHFSECTNTDRQISFKVYVCKIRGKLIYFLCYVWMLVASVHMRRQ
jgi:hypothetical protein